MVNQTLNIVNIGIFDCYIVYLRINSANFPVFVEYAERFYEKTNKLLENDVQQFNHPLPAQ